MEMNAFILEQLTFFHKDVENSYLQMGPLAKKRGQVHVLNLNQIQTRNTEKAKSTANHGVWHKTWLVVRVWKQGWKIQFEN